MRIIVWASASRIHQYQSCVKARVMRAVGGPPSEARRGAHLPLRSPQLGESDESVSVEERFSDLVQGAERSLYGALRRRAPRRRLARSLASVGCVEGVAAAVFTAVDALCKVAAEGSFYCVSLHLRPAAS